MLRALSRLLRRGSPNQLELVLETRPATPADLLAELRALGLPPRIERCRLTRNRTVMVSFSGPELRLHEGYLGAPAPVLEAVVTFVRARTRAERARARAVIVGHQIERPAAPARRPSRPRAEDAELLRALAEWHARYNAQHFGGRLRPITVRLSRRMKSRLGHYTAATPAGDPAEIAVGLAHLRRHGWDEVLHTLLHEMVHQWQDETGRPIDHGAEFRAKAREVGITPFARRTVTAARTGQGARRPSPSIIGLRAAREE